MWEPRGFASASVAPGPFGGGGGAPGAAPSQQQRRRLGAQLVLLSVLLLVLVIVRQVVFDAVAGLPLHDAALLKGRATGKVFVEADPVSLAVVFPFHASDVERVEASLEGWGGPGGAGHAHKVGPA